MSGRKRKATESGNRSNVDMMTALREVVSSSIAPIVERLQSLEQSSRSPSSGSMEMPNLATQPRFENGLVMVQTPTKPTFDGCNIHPIIFLDDLEIYITRIRAQKNDLKVTMDCLTGEARSWARIFIANWKDFSDFRADFLDQFWGRDTQNKIRRKISNGKWDTNKSKTMLGHFISVYDEAKMLSVHDERELINQIMDHFPQEVRRMWYKDGGGGAETAVRFLKSMDMGSDDITQSRKLSVVPNTEKPKVARMSAALEQIRSGYHKSWSAEGSQDKVIDLEKRATTQEEN